MEAFRAYFAQKSSPLNREVFEFVREFNQSVKKSPGWPFGKKG